MLTLRELREELEIVPKKGRETPRSKSLLESGEEVLISFSVAGAEITVFVNGYVLYQSEAGVTVFPFPEENCYLYESVCSGMEGEITEDEFENMDWYVRLVLEGEDHLRDNADRRYYYHTVSYSAVAEDWKELSDASASVEEYFLEEEEREAATHSLDVLTKKQRHVVTEHFFNEMPYVRIAENLGVTRQAVRDMMGKAMNQMRKHLAEDACRSLA